MRKFNLDPYELAPTMEELGVNLIQVEEIAWFNRSVCDDETQDSHVSHTCAQNSMHCISLSDAQHVLSFCVEHRSILLFYVMDILFLTGLTGSGVRL